MTTSTDHRSPGASAPGAHPRTSGDLTQQSLLRLGGLILGSNQLIQDHLHTPLRQTGPLWNEKQNEQKQQNHDLKDLC